MDVVSLCSQLIKCKSVTPNDDGAIQLLQDFLQFNGFETKILTFKSKDGSNEVKNLFARYGVSEKKILGFLGHSDVVPAGDGWEVNPFEAVQKDGYLFGRGITDMKGGIGAFCCAAAEFVKQKFDGSMVLLITGDEEIGSKEGAESLIDWCHLNHQLPHDCIIGEPSSRVTLGDRAYIGHRGSINALIKSVGKQGHIAYAGNFDNSLASICKFVAKMMDYQWRHCIKTYPKTNLEPTLLFTNNYAVNVAPDITSVNLNLRFGADYSSDEIKKIIMDEAAAAGLSVEFSVSGEPYICDNENLKQLLSNSIAAITGIKPEFSASGGISDGRYMIKHCNIIEFGLLDDSLHQKNEKAKIEDLHTLEKIYFKFISGYFG